MRTAHTLHTGYGLPSTAAGRLDLSFGIFARRSEKYSGYGVEPISDDIKVGWVGKPNIFRRLSGLCWVFSLTYAYILCLI